MKEYLKELSGDTFNAVVTDNIESIKEDWNATTRDSFYYDPRYLKVLEEKGPNKYQYFYCLLKRNGDPVAVYYFQKKQISLYEDFRLHTHSKNPIVKFFVWLQRQSFRLINQQLLVAGNVLLTGEYSFYYCQDCDTDTKTKISDFVFKSTCEYVKHKSGKKVSAILSKDFYVEEKFKVDDFYGSNFTKFKVQPDMVVSINQDWRSYDDYLAAVKSKYRVKFKKVAKRGGALEFRDLNVEDLESLNDEMYALYSKTADKASFSLFKLHPEYFLELKKIFGDDFIVRGVFLNGKMVAFFTIIINGKNADAHFLGYDVSLNSKHQIYFNVLLKLVEAAILQRAEYLNLSRTALEIKSSVGAEPYAMHIYLKHNTNFLNKLLPVILARIVPKEDWIQRVPFK
ncbi:MAG: GNAT family N-acetyltransferase [Saprospiraceae bacterium]|nr:GNAT family N-acetyltransferase [Saprospiraceae bacterium]